MGGQPLTVGMVPNRLLELGDAAFRFTEREVGVDTLLEGQKSPLLDRSGLAIGTYNDPVGPYNKFGIYCANNPANMPPSFAINFANMQISANDLAELDGSDTWFPERVSPVMCTICSVRAGMAKTTPSVLRTAM